MKGETERARELVRGGRQVFVEAGSLVTAGGSSMNEAELALEQGDVEEAEMVLRDGLELLERLGDQSYYPTVSLMLCVGATQPAALRRDSTTARPGTRDDGRAFDVAFSNSVIEHVPPERHAAFASEIRRVADRYFVQTPNRWFPIEPHYQLPLFQFFPRSLRTFLNAHFSLGWQSKGHWEEITLLSASDLRRLFPDATIYRERVFGLTKSLMAVRSYGGRTLHR